MAYPYYQNQYMNNYNPYYQPQQMQQPIQQPQQQTNQQPIQQFMKPIALQGKSVDNIEVVKATDIPLDGSVSYFPLVDGSAIVTKQLGANGASQIVIYKPIENNTEIEISKYVTEKDLEEKLKGLQSNDYATEIKSLKRQIKALIQDIEDIKNGKDE